METDSGKIGVRLGALERDITVIKANYVTKEDLHREVAATHREINAQIWKLVTFVCGYGTVLVSATYFIATHAK